MGTRPRHQRKDLEFLIRKAEATHWTVTKGNRYFKALCPCAEKHMKWIALTPSDPNYAKNVMKWFERQTCWPKGRKKR